MDASVIEKDDMNRNMMIKKICDYNYMTKFYILRFFYYERILILLSIQIQSFFTM